MSASFMQPMLWDVPYQRNPFFTGLEETLGQLHDILHAENAVALSHPLGISGLGGIGKTQTALEYAYRYCADYDAVFWVRADSTTALTSSFVNLAFLLNLPEQNEQDQNIIVEAVLRWLRLHIRWLLVFDNMDDLSIAESFLPKGGLGHILFTTRAQALGGIAQRLEVQQMEPETGALLLLRRSGILPLRSLLDRATTSDRSMACDISQELDGLPLALDQAGAYVKETPCSLGDYLALYQTRRQGLLRIRGSSFQDYPASVATTWSLSFEKITQSNPAAAELLDFCAFLAPDAIPEEVITGGADYLDPQLQNIATNPLLFDQSIATLLAYSLVARNAEKDILSIHRLVQVVLQDSIPHLRKKYWMECVVRVINEAFSSVKFASWRICERSLPHALIGVGWIEREQMTFPEAVSLLNQAGYYLKARGRYAEAKGLYVRALAIREQKLGAEHLHTARGLNNLAALYRAQGKDAEAEALYARALAIREQQLGSDHPYTARSLNNLAALYRARGKDADAEALYIRALSIREQQLGANHPYTARSLNNLAKLYRAQGKETEAEALYVQALAIREQLLGVDHPYTASSLNNLAALYLAQGRDAEAEALYLRALAIREQQLGAEHPATATSLNNLAKLYRARGKETEAEALYVRALAIRERQLGAEHPATATSLNNLAGLYKHQRKYVEAEALYTRALAVREQQLGVQHPKTAQSLNVLANIYYRQRKYTEAEALYVRALSLYEQRPELEYPATRSLQQGYISLLRTLGRDEEAKKREADFDHFSQQ